MDGLYVCFYFLTNWKRNLYVLCLREDDGKRTTEHSIYLVINLIWLQLAVGINVLSILSSEQYFWTKSAESGKCYITFQIHQHAMKINHSHFLTACCRHFTSTALWLCSEVFDNVYMRLKSMTVSVKLNSGSSLPVSSTVPFTSHRPHGAAWGSLADRTSKPEQSEQVADRLSRLKRPQVGYWVGLLYWFLIGTNLPVEWEEISDDIRIYDARSKKVVWAFSESLFHVTRMIKFLTRCRRLSLLFHFKSV